MMSLMSIEPVATDAARPASKGQKSEDERARELAVKAQVEDVKRQVKKRWPLVVGGFVGVWLLGVLVYAQWPSGPATPPQPVKLLPMKTPVVAVKDPTPDDPTRSPDDPKKGPPVADPTPTVKDPDDLAPVATDPLVIDDAGDTVPTAVASGALGKFVDNNSVVDDVTIGEFRREERDGQSIERMLNRMSTEIGSNSEKRELFETKLIRVKDQCEAANTKLKLLNCDDDVRRLHIQFYRVVD